MRKFFKSLFIVIAIVMAGIFIWGYAPDIPAEELKAKYANSESEFIGLDNGLNIHLRDEGPSDAPTIILLHGSNASLHTWQQWTDKLKDKYRIIRFDLPGHGLTGPHPNACYNAECFAKVIDDVAQKKGVSNFIIGGNSMGGWITHEYSKRHPDKVMGQILVDASGAPKSQPKSLPIGFRLMRIPILRNIFKIITPRAAIERSLLQSVSNKDIVTENEIDEYWELQRYPGNRQATIDRFSSYGDRQPDIAISKAASAIPTLIIWGAEDKLIPPTAANWFAASYPNSNAHIYPNIGHLPMEEHAEQSGNDVLNWVDGLSMQPNDQNK